MKSLSKKAISLILAVLMIMDVFTPVAVVASANSPQNNVHVLDEVPESETNSQNNEILIPATPQKNPKDDTLLPAEVPGQNSSQNSSQKPAQKPAQNNKTPNQSYKSWTLVNPGKTTYAKGDILDLSQLSVRVTKEDGTVTTLSYVQLLKDTNFDVIENVGNKINLQPGKGSVTLVGPNLNPITVNIVVNDSTDKLQGTNSNDELVPAIDAQAKEENDELVVAENPNDKKTNIIEGNEQNSPEKELDKQKKEDKLEEEVLKGNVFDQVLGKDTENPFGLKLFKNQNEADILAGIDELSRMMAEFRSQFPTEQTQEEIDAGLIRIYNINPVDPVVQDKPMSPVFLRSAFRSAGLFEAASFNADQNQGLEMSGEEIPEPVGADSNGLNLDGKKFTVMTRFETSNALGPIQPGQFFNIHLDEKLLVKDPSTLEPLRYNGEVIARPTYDFSKNIITYTIIREIPENIKVPVNIPVDYNQGKITLGTDGTFTVTNKVSGLGVKAPKDLVPQKVDKNGNLAGSIIEPGRGDVPELIEADDKSYKVDMDAVGIPVVKDGKLEGFNWTAQVVSTKNLAEIDFHVNFTTVKGSGLGQIQNLALDGGKVDNPDNNGLTGKLGIVDSIHYNPNKKQGNKFTYTFYTPVTAIQETYMLDINAVANNKVGAKRIVGTQGYPRSKVEDATPNRVGMNNRTSILGEFTSETSAKWTVTDQVSTSDDGKLPLESRQLGGNQTLQTGQVAIYGIDKATGKMVQIGSVENANPIPGAGENAATGRPQGTEGQPVGTIAAYEYTTSINQPEDKNSLTLGGVAISKYEDLSIDQNWGLPARTNMPAQNIYAVDNSGTKVSDDANVPEGTDGQSTRRITVPNAKVWDIDLNGKATRNQPKIQQDLPKDFTSDSKNYKAVENYNYYEPDRKEYYVHNRAIAEVNKKYGSFTLYKVGTYKNEQGAEVTEKLPGATFRLFPGPEVVTDKDGKATFSNIEPGTYTLMEVQAPAGYKPAADTKIVVDENGKVLATGPNASQEGDKTATQYEEDEKYPLFMNLKSYAVGKKGEKMTTYIYLKPREGGGTNQNTRLNIIGYDNSNINVQVFDVSPAQRPAVSQAMDLQNSPEKSAGGNVLNQVHNFAITGYPNVTDGFSGKKGYQIKFPFQRFGTNWGFLVKVEGKNNSTNGTVFFEWLLDGDKDTVKSNSKIQKAIYPVDPSNTSNNTNNTGGSTGNQSKDTIVTIKNEKFETSPVEVTKVNSDKEKLGNAIFVLKDSDNNILKTVTSISTEGKDKGKVSFGKMPPGHYVIEEIQSPDGYINSQVVFDVVVDKTNQVTYTPRFKDGKGTPIQGVDYWIENEVIADEDTKVPVTWVEQKMYISENNPGEIGTQDGVWEAYRYESLNYDLHVKASKASPGGRLTIQFDPNLDFTQYVNEIPKIKDGNDVLAEPYFNYDSNTLTYVFTDKAKGGALDYKLQIQGIIPSKFYAKNSGEYTFTNKVAPDQGNVQGNASQTVTIKGFYDDYDSRTDSPTQMYYFRDVYKEGDQWYVKALAYYNPKANAEGGRRNARTLSFNWMTTNWFGDRNIARWEGYGSKPAFELDDLKVYRVLPVPTGFKNYVTNEPNMPRSMGIIPENDPNTYKLVYSHGIDPDKPLYNSQGNISVSYDPSKIISSGVINTSLPLAVSMPKISSANEGYVIEQTFKVTDLDKFRTKFRTFYMTNGNLESAFASKVNLNESAASQASKEIPKYYKQTIMMVNENYVPTKFSIRKLSEADKKLLAGAVFTLIDSNNNRKSKTSGLDGIITFDNLQPGEYTLKETKAPENFNKVEKTWNINVSKDGYVTIREISFDGQGDYLAGDNLTLDVSNRPTGTDFKVYKKDDKNQPLQGAEFTLKKDKMDGDVVQTVKSDTNGVVNFEKLKEGTYILEEKTPPAGFKKINKSWVVEVGANNKVKVYEYKDPNAEKPPEKENTDATKSLFGEDGTKWVNVGKRPLNGWTLDDNRWGGYVGNNHQPYKMGTRILGINKKDGYVIQRYVINPEGNKVNLNYASIHREKPWYNNMDWYEGKGAEPYKIFTLDKPVTGYVEDIRLQNYNIKDITSSIKTEGKVISGQNRLYLNFENKDYDKPIIIDVKVPYESVNGGVGTGMDLYADGAVYWKSDYYESVSYIVEGDDVVKKKEDQSTQDIKGDHVSDDSLDVTNERNKYEFKFKKVDQNKMTDVVTGATFKLTGPHPSTETKWAYSGKDSKDSPDRGDGMVYFRDLVPGTYKLEETGAAQGYEKANTDWTVTILADGKVYIKDNNPGNTVPDNNPEHKWQKVKVNEGTKDNKSVSQNKDFETRPKEKLNTNIVEVNNTTHRMRQVYILNNSPENLNNPELQIHAQPENRDITDKNTKIVSIREVDKTSTTTNIVNPGNTVPYKVETISHNGHNRLKINTEVTGEKALEVTIETDMPTTGSIGTGMDFKNYTNTYWAAESYADANNFVLEPIQESKVGKNSNLQVDKDFKEANHGATRLAEEDGTSLSNTVALTANEDVSSVTSLSKALRSRFFRSVDGLELGDEIVGKPVGAGNGWEKVDPSKSEGRAEIAHENNMIKTRISEIDKTKDRFKQVFLFTDGSPGNERLIEIHRQPEDYELRLGFGKDIETIVNVYKVNSSNIDEALKGSKTKISATVTQKDAKTERVNGKHVTKPRRVQISVPGTQRGYILVEVETSYKKDVGLGSDYWPNRTSTYTKYWVGDSYSSEAGINKNVVPEKTYSLTLNTPDGNGTLTVKDNKTTGIKYQELVSVTANPKQGYELADLKINGTSYFQLGKTTYEFNMPNGNSTIEATFKKSEMQPKSHSITVYGASNGKVEVQQSAVKGERVKFNITPKQGYQLASVIVAGRSGQVQIENGNEFVMPDEDVSINVSFTILQPQTYTISTNVSEGGSVTPTQSTATAGKTIGLDINPAEGYRLESVNVVDENDIKTAEYNFLYNNFTMPAKNVTVKVTFAKIQYSIIKEQSQGGTVSIDKTTATKDEKVTITVTPDEGYEVGQVTGDNIPIRLIDGKYPFKMPARDVTIRVTFNKKEAIPETIYDVGIDGNTNRKVVVYTRTAPDKAKAGELVEFTVTPNLDYEITSVYVKLSDGSGKNVEPLNHDGNKYSFTMPNQAVTIYANVKYVQPPANSYIVGISTNIVNGSASTDKQRAVVGDKVRITATPIKGYSLESLSVTKQWGGNVDVQYDNQGPYFIMPSDSVTVYAKFKEGQGPNPGGGSDVQPDDNELGYLIYDPTRQDGKFEKETKITNKKQGFVPKIFKRNFIGRPLEGATFTVKKMTDNTYKTVDNSFASVTATSDDKGNVTFKDQSGNIVALEKGFYILTEDKAPTGYKKIIADWKIEVKDDGGRVYAVYKGPEDTPSSLVNDNEKAKAGDTTKENIIVKSRLTDINPESKTFVQRIYIDTRKHSGIVNVQIIPKHKREEIDRPGLPPVTIKEGVKTAYRSTYKIANPGSNKDIADGKFDHILRTYDLSGDNVTMINTARWRPFDWGFDEDQLNLEQGVYIVEVEGYYDDSIIDKRVTNEVKINENYKFLDKNDNVTKDPTLKVPYDRTDLDEKDLAKLDLHVDLYEGKREFKQLKVDANGNASYEVVDKGSYQGGAAQVTDFVKSKKGEEAAKTWSNTQDHKTKYANFVGKEVVLNGNKTYITGKVEPALGTPLLHADTSVNLKPIYDSEKEQELPKEGMEIINDEETYNITFSKHGKDDPNWADNGEQVTRNRLEGAIFKLQELAPGGYIDMPGTFVASAFNGYFGFRGLKPGRYRLMEVKAPEGYKPIKDAILYMTIKYTGDIVDGKTGEITPGKGLVTLEYNENANGIIKYAPGENATEKDGKLVDYVTSATAKNMGKIINEKPGKGKVTIYKKDGGGNALSGANFKLTRLSSKLQEDPTKPADGTTGVSYNKESATINETAIATIASKEAPNPKVQNGKIISLDPVRVGDTSISGESIPNAEVTVKFSENSQFKVTTSTSGKFTVNVPGEVILSENNQITANIKGKGLVVFDELAIGNYVLEETKSPDGYQNKGQKWYFTVGGKGLDPYAGPVTRKGEDLTKLISITKSDIEVVKPNAGDTTEAGTIKPNSAHVLSIKSNFKLADGMEIRPGDYFKVKLSDYMDLKGIYDKELIDGLDIFAEGIGTIAKANYDYDNGIITYTFTDYANTYDLKDFETTLTGHIRRDKLRYSENNVPVGIMMLNGTNTFKNIKVVYELDTASHTDRYGNNLNIASKITRFNPQTGEFEHIIYLNREQRFSTASTLVYKPGTDVENLHVEEFKINEKWTQSQYRKDNIDLFMPPSFYLDPANYQYFRKPTDETYSKIVNDESPAKVQYNDGDLDWNDTYIIRMTGRIANGKDRSYFNPTVRIDNIVYPVWSAREDYVYEQWNKNLAEGKLEITAINPMNEITFKKLDQSGEILPGATFKLVKYNEGTKKWDDVADSTKTSGTDGLIKFEKLAPGKYGLVETEAPDGYSKIEGNAVEFTVEKDGVITRKVTKPKDQVPVGQDPGEKPKEGTSTINLAGENQGASSGESTNKKVDMVTVDEPVGNGPINVINYKDIEFQKVDAELDGDNKKVFLPGAEFEVYKKDENGDYKPYKIKNSEGKEETMIAKSGAEGKFKVSLNKPGDYALKETKAPEKYAKMPGWIKEFRLADGKLYTLEKDPIKASHTDSPHGWISSEVVSLDKEKGTFKQRIVINPNHDNFTIPNDQSYLRIFENGWSITPKADGENNGGKVKVALIGKDSTKKISDLKETDFKEEYSPEIYKPEDGNTRSAYSLKTITGNSKTDGSVTTTDSIVVEYTGTLAQGNTKVDQKAEVILNYSIEDHVEYSLDWTVLTENKSVYAEHKLTVSVQVENKKAEYPGTGGMGTFIFTSCGLALMGLAYLSYRRRRGLVFDE